MSFTHGITVPSILRLALRFLQFVLGIAVIGLYAQDLRRAGAAGVGADSRWVYAVVVGTLSSIVAIPYLLPKWDVRRVLWPADWVLFVLWIALFGVFARLYVHEDAEDLGNGHGDGPGITRMKNAVWVDLTNALLWLASAVWGTMLFFFAKRRTLHTGRADV